MLTYYGVIQEILELDYHFGKVPMFRCQWVGSEKGLKIIRIEDGLTLINFRNATKYPKDLFILAEHASQVFSSSEAKDH